MSESFVGSVYHYDGYSYIFSDKLTEISDIRRIAEEINETLTSFTTRPDTITQTLTDNFEGLHNGIWGINLNLEALNDKLTLALESYDTTEETLLSIKTYTEGLHEQLSSISNITGNLEQITEDYGSILETISTNAAELTAPIIEFNETIAEMNVTLWTVNDNLVTIGNQINYLYIVILATVGIAAAWKILGTTLFRS
jgi:methyl-accepting chemotaxis protein